MVAEVLAWPVPLVVCSDCGQPGRVIHARQMCRACYQRWYRRNSVEISDNPETLAGSCVQCGRVARFFSRKMCSRCYNRYSVEYRKANFAEGASTFSCLYCGGGPHYAKGMCKRCYGRVRWFHPVVRKRQKDRAQELAQLRREGKEPALLRRPRSMRVCVRCERERPHQAKGLCSSCYSNSTRQKRRGRYVQNPDSFSCAVCGGGPHSAKGLCHNCYVRNLYWQKRGLAMPPFTPAPPPVEESPATDKDDTKERNRLGITILGVCSVSPDCLECPLTVCRYDEGGAEALRQWRLENHKVGV